MSAKDNYPSTAFKSYKWKEWKLHDNVRANHSNSGPMTADSGLYSVA